MKSWEWESFSVSVSSHKTKSWSKLLFFDTTQLHTDYRFSVNTVTSARVSDVCTHHVCTCVQKVYRFKCLSPSTHIHIKCVWVMDCLHMLTHISSSESVCHVLSFSCVRVGRLHTHDLTADWHTDHQHSSRQPWRTLSGCQEVFRHNTEVIKGLPLYTS